MTVIFVILIIILIIASSLIFLSVLKYSADIVWIIKYLNVDLTPNLSRDKKLMELIFEHFRNKTTLINFATFRIVEKLVVAGLVERKELDAMRVQFEAYRQDAVATKRVKDFPFFLLVDAKKELLEINRLLYVEYMLYEDDCESFNRVKKFLKLYHKDTYNR